MPQWLKSYRVIVIFTESDIETTFTLLKAPKGAASDGGLRSCSLTLKESMKSRKH